MISTPDWECVRELQFPSNDHTTELSCPFLLDLRRQDPASYPRASTPPHQIRALEPLPSQACRYLPTLSAFSVATPHYALAVEYLSESTDIPDNRCNSHARRNRSFSSKRAWASTALPERRSQICVPQPSLPVSCCAAFQVDDVTYYVMIIRNHTTAAFLQGAQQHQHLSRNRLNRSIYHAIALARSGRILDDVSTTPICDFLTPNILDDRTQSTAIAIRGRRQIQR